MAREPGQPVLMLELCADDYALTLAPERGGSILRFDWRGGPLMRPARGTSILDVACFPLVPFSNRIANGHFVMGARNVLLSPNFPGSNHPHPLHGFGWLAQWTVLAVTARSATLQHEYGGGEWPWPYLARQEFALDEDGLAVGLTLTNLADEPMPAGLGLHPYFPRGEGTTYRGLHGGEWQNDRDCLPLIRDKRASPIDWWHSRPVGTRLVDTVYSDRDGDLEISWPERGLALSLRPSKNLPFTVVFVPAGEDYFCLEPVSHMTDAVNRPAEASGLVMLAPKAMMSASVHFRARDWDKTQAHRGEPSR